MIAARVGTNVAGDTDFGNGQDGIFLGHETSGTTVGSTSASELVKVAFNRGNGLTFHSSRRNTITGAQIVDNRKYGLFAVGNCAGTVVQGSTIKRNLTGDVNLSRARGIVYIPVA